MRVRSVRQEQDWILRGYADFLDRTIYRRAPASEPPRVPDYMLPKEWQLYFEGFRGASTEAISKVMRKKEALGDSEICQYEIEKAEARFGRKVVLSPTQKTIDNWWLKGKLKVIQNSGHHAGVWFPAIYKIEERYYTRLKSDTIYCVPLFLAKREDFAPVEGGVDVAKKKVTKKKVAKKRFDFAKAAKRKYTLTDIGVIADCASGCGCRLGKIGIKGNAGKMFLNMAKSIYAKFKGHTLKQQPAFLWARRALKWAKTVQPSPELAREASAFIKTHFPRYA